MATSTKTKYNLKDANKMIKSLSSGTNLHHQVDANNDGRKDNTDVETIMKFAAGWSPKDAMDPYKGREVSPSEYGSKQEYLLGKVTDRQPFSFSGTDSPLYKAYAKQYKREGDLAAKDTLSKVSARTGGVPSSYAVTATAAQQNQYAGALADKIPELYEMEYNQYAADAERDRADLSTLMGVKSQDMSDAYNAASVGDYSKLQGMDVDTSKLKENDALETAMQKFQLFGDESDLVALGYDPTYLYEMRGRETADWKAGYGDYTDLEGMDVDTSKLKDDYARTIADWKAGYGDTSGAKALGVDTSYMDKTQSQAIRDNDASYAITMYNTTGDLKYLEAMGADTGYIKQGRDLDYALQAASYGDYKYLNAMGIDTSKLARDENWNRALTMAEMGDYSGLRAFGLDTSAIEESKAWDKAMNAAEYGDYAPLKALGVNTEYLESSQAFETEYNQTQLDQLKGSSKYTDEDHAAANITLAMGPNYWDDSFKEYTRSVYGMEPIDLYYYAQAYDEEGKATGVTYYDAVSSALDEKGYNFKILTEDEWDKMPRSGVFSSLKKDMGVTGYTDYLRKIAKTYL